MDSWVLARRLRSVLEATESDSIPALDRILESVRAAESAGATEEQLASIESSLEDFRKRVEGFEVNASPILRAHLEQLGVQEVVGLALTQRVQVAMQSAVAGLPGIRQALERIRNEVKEAADKSRVAINALVAFGLELEDSLRGPTLGIRLNADPNDTADSFSSSLSGWTDFLDALTEIHTGRHEPTRIVALSTGSADLWFGLPPETVAALSQIVASMLQLVVSLQEVRRMRDSVAQNPVIVNIVIVNESAIDTERDKAIDATVANLLSGSLVDAGRTQELRSRVARGVRTVFRHLDEGRLLGLESPRQLPPEQQDPNPETETVRSVALRSQKVVQLTNEALRRLATLPPNTLSLPAATENNDESPVAKSKPKSPKPK